MHLFHDSGLKMFAFTTKHHDGFSMFDTKTRVRHRVNWTAPGGPKIEPCDLAYSIMETPFGRDVVKELTTPRTGTASRWTCISRTRIGTTPTSALTSITRSRADARPR